MDVFLIKQQGAALLKIHSISYAKIVFQVNLKLC